MEEDHISVAFVINGKLQLLAGILGCFYMSLPGSDVMTLVHEHTQAVELVSSYGAEQWKVFTEYSDGTWKDESSDDQSLPPQSETREDQ